MTNKKGELGTLFNMLHKPNDLSKIKDNLTMVCRFSDEEKKSRFYKAPIFRGTQADWPEGKTYEDSCKSEVQESINPIQGLYGGIQYAKMDKVDMKRLKPVSEDDWIDLRKSVRAIHPIYQILKKERVLVYDRAKFCTSWRREKLRRSAGRCVIKHFNDVLYDQTKDCRNTYKSTLCDLMKQDHDAQVSAAVDNLNAVKKAKSDCVSAQNLYSACKKKDPNSKKCGSWRDCSTHDDSIKTAQKTVDCFNSASFNSQNCENGIDILKVGQTYSPTPTVNVSSCSGSLNYDRSYNDDIRFAKCWSVDKMKPRTTAEYKVHDTGIGQSASGDVGVVADSETIHSWSKDAACVTGTDVDLAKISSDCRGYYQEIADISDNKHLCDDNTKDLTLSTCKVDIEKDLPPPPPPPPPPSCSPCDCANNSDTTKTGGTCSVTGDPPNCVYDYSTCTGISCPPCNCAKNPDTTKTGGTCSVTGTSPNCVYDYSNCTDGGSCSPCDCANNSDTTKTNGTCSIIATSPNCVYNYFTCTGASQCRPGQKSCGSACCSTGQSCGYANINSTVKDKCCGTLGCPTGYVWGSKVANDPKKRQPAAEVPDLL